LSSLKDLYSQFPDSQGKLKRFGSDIFRRGTGNSSDLPMDLPMGPDYVLGPGDALVLNLWGSTSQRLNRTIDRQGQIALPEAGPISIAGFTIAHAQESIQQALNGQFKNTRVEISLGRVRTVRVYVVGDVQRPGAYDISALSTCLNALYAAGGPTNRGSLRTLRQYRGEKLVREIDLYELLLRGIHSDVDHLLPGDTILVPPIGAQVTVSGMVRRPAIYELKDEQGMKEVLDLAGGVLVSGTLRQISVERIEAHERRTMLSVQLPQGGTQDKNDNKLDRYHVQDGDRVLVSPILPYNEKTVYLGGHVFRPGKYAFRDGMTVNDLLRSYQDVMPEPAEHAEIVRLQPPDFRPATVSFSLSEILNGDDPISLQPFDVIRIFSRYEIDPPEVFIYGEVLRPGKYPMASGMTVAGLVQMAGGFKRSAYLESADLSSYVVQDGRNVLTRQTVVRLGKALEGDSSADVVLKPGDVASIRQLTGWNDIGASVNVKGEVAHAGTYGIQAGERLSSVLKRAGGFRNTSYPAGAMLERTEVRELGEKTRLELIRRIETTNVDTKAGLSNSQEQQGNMQAMQQQRQQTLEALRSHHASGRLVINIGSDIAKWENTPADVEMRAGDTLFIPKRPDFVLVSGQVFNASAITYEPGRQAGWYLRQAGGPTQTANKKSIFILRASGSVIGGTQGLWKGGVLDARLQPGDSIVVPEKITGGSQLWKNLISVAQLASSAAVTSAVVTQF
jgi:protein involved in polysaccharide export with SLBB domain